VALVADGGRGLPRRTAAEVLLDQRTHDTTVNGPETNFFKTEPELGLCLQSSGTRVADVSDHQPDLAVQAGDQLDVATC
jgi:hypothetical protein